MSAQLLTPITSPTLSLKPGRLAGKVALITGAGSVGPGWGNGRAIAVRFAQEGAAIFGVDRDMERMTETARLVTEAGGTFVAASCDVTSSADIAAVVTRCMAELGRIDILVNNVGGSAKGGPVVTQGSGAIVNIASTSGTRWTGAAQIAYAATKAGVIQFSRVLAVQYAKQGLRVNTVVPGQLHTPMVEVRLAGQRAGGDVEALLKQRQSRIPLPFMGDGRDTANAALYLASDEARFVTGTEIVVDGGMSVRCD
jgi:NAD(P)-dependent dehydrogenase (short-subunit alcohol dehydrogenase family)